MPAFYYIVHNPTFMKRFRLGLYLAVFLNAVCHAQQQAPALIHAHNDYVHPIPFFTAYYQEAGSIEADIFLYNGQLCVAHTDKEIDLKKTLEALYLMPLQEKVRFHGGKVYAKDKPLTLMIDLKTPGATTIPALVKVLQKYPTLTSCPSLTITLSGSVPEPATWSSYPAFIHFDGRPAVTYTPEQLARISMMSDDFSRYTVWNGKGVILAQDRKKIEDVIQSVHARGKKFRFWATPDVINAWITLGKLGVDYIGTDKVVDLSTFMKQTPHVTYTNADVHRVAPAPVLPASTAVARNIIFLIGDGMGLAQQYAGYTANHGALNLFTMPVVGLSITTSADRYITDSAAGATAMASGKKTNNRAVGVDSLSRPIPSIITPLRQHRFRTGVISTGDITDATPAAFYGHSADRASSEVIAADFLTSDIDVLIGAGSGHFLQRKDGRDLRGELQQKGYTVATDVRTLDTLRSSKFVLLDNALGLSMKQGRGPLLATTLDKTLQTFSTGPLPFFIMAEGAQIDWGGHSNDMEYVVREMLNFDEAVGRAMQYVAKHPETLLVVTADHETGGLTLLDGDLKTGHIRGHFSTDDHTATPVMVFAYGAGASNFAGVYQNTELYKKMLKVLGIQP